MKKILFFSLFFFSIAMFSQDSIGVKKKLYKINFLTPGFVYEYGLSDKMSLHSKISLGFFWKYDNILGSTTGFNVNLDEQLRYYYNFDRRFQKRKDIKNNSANYFALVAAVSSKPFAGSNLDNYVYYNTLLTGVVYGYNRNSRKLNNDFNFGFGLGFNGTKNTYFIPIINYSLGWIIFDKK